MLEYYVAWYELHLCTWDEDVVAAERRRREEGEEAREATCGKVDQGCWHTNNTKKRTQIWFVLLRKKLSVTISRCEAARWQPTTELKCSTTSAR